MSHPYIGHGNACTTDTAADGRTIVNCTGQNRPALESTSLSDATATLLLSKCKLPAIPTALLQKTPNLTVLDLSSNLITIITADSFNASTNLQALVLDWNNLLTEVHANAFSNLGHLRNLSMETLFSLTVIYESHFAPLVSLRRLTFGNLPNLVTPDVNLFSALRNVIEIEVYFCGTISVALPGQSFGIATLPLVRTLYVFLTRIMGFLLCCALGVFFW